MEIKEQTQAQKISTYKTQMTKLKKQLEKQVDKYFTFKTHSLAEKDILESKYQSTLKGIEEINQKYSAEKQQAKDKVSTLEIKLEELRDEYNTIKESTAIIQSHLESKVEEQKAHVKQLTDKIEELLTVPDILIEDSTPPVPEEHFEEEEAEIAPLEITTTHSPPKKLSWFRVSVNKIKKIFGRK